MSPYVMKKNNIPLENIWRVHWYFFYNLLKLLPKFSSDKFSHETILYLLMQLPPFKKTSGSGIINAKLNASLLN